MPSVLSLYKPPGITPLQCIDAFRETHQEYADIKLGYAGRLDPMAEGLLLVLVGDENKKRKEYELLPKKYEFDMLFGVTTDTYDLLGIIQKYTESVISLDDEMIKEQIKKYIGIFPQPYPPYSSVRVNGKPLYYWARKNMLSDLNIPTKNIHIMSFEFINRSTMTIAQLKSKIWDTVPHITGEFRQQEILEHWTQFFQHVSAPQYPIATFSVECSSGTYIRSLVHTLGDVIGCGALTLRISRIQVGPYTIETSLR